MSNKRLTADEEKRIRANVSEAPIIKWNFPWEDVVTLLAEIDALRAELDARHVNWPMTQSMKLW